ncbi:hypothetical protein C8F04DRAFT_1177424 [Mycena alexandri]|uniref:Uncharacterized protein n=1 Tax=Mycena alexandri TaxID=1745969 RepID=A0AAD6T904_9AGAR|nr:hypothetical protein C8F04DRAFT_1177424 [Mycena alexandri]
MHRVVARNQNAPTPSELFIESTSLQVVLRRQNTPLPFVYVVVGSFVLIWPPPSAQSFSESIMKLSTRDSTNIELRGWSDISIFFEVDGAAVACSAVENCFEEEVVVKTYSAVEFLFLFLSAFAFGSCNNRLSPPEECANAVAAFDVQWLNFLFYVGREGANLPGLRVQKREQATRGNKGFF